MATIQVQQRDGGVVLGVKVVPGSSRTALGGLLDGMLKVKVAAPPEKGRANEVLIRFLAARLGLRRTEVRIVAGRSSPVKQVWIGGRSPDEVVRELGL